MIIDPRNHRRRDVRQDVDQVSPAHLAGIIVTARGLWDLAEWEPVGSRLEGLADAMRGHGGLTAKEARRVQRWASRWQQLRDEVRTFYVQAVQIEGKSGELASRALVRVLEGGERLPGWHRGRIESLYVDLMGRRPAVDLTPIRSSS